MSSVFLRSYRYAVSAISASDAPAKRLLSPEPALTYRSTTSTATINADLQTLKTVNSVALVGARLNATDTIRVQLFDAANVQVSDVSVRAFSGTARDGAAIVYVALQGDFMARYVRVTVQTSRSIVEVSRLLIGDRLEIDGIDSGPEITPTSGSTVEDGPGWTTTVSARTRISWKATAGNVKPADLWNRWLPFSSGVGLHEDWLFIPDTSSNAFQQQAVLVRQQANAKITEVTSDRFKVELQLLEV